MSFENRSEPLRLDRDLPTTRADVVVLRQLRHQTVVSLAVALDQLSQIESLLRELPPHRLSRDWEPFSL